MPFSKGATLKANQDYVRNCFWIPKTDERGQPEPIPFSNESGPLTCSLDGYAIIPRALYNEICLMSRCPNMAARLMGANLNMVPKEPLVTAAYHWAIVGAKEEGLLLRRAVWDDGTHIKWSGDKIWLYAAGTKDLTPKLVPYDPSQGDKDATDWEIMDGVPEKEEGKK